jgi:hypothetical protein
MVAGGACGSIEGNTIMTVIKLPGVKLPPQPPAEMPYLEPYPAPEFFCAELMRVHVHGAFTRLTFTTVDMIAEDPHAGPQNVAVCKIVVPTAALPALYEAIGKRPTVSAADFPICCR